VVNTVIAKMGIWAGFVAVIVVALMFGTVANSVAAAPATTYTVKVTQMGVPSGTTWSAQLNGVTLTSTTSSISFTGVAASSYYVYTSTVAGPTDTQYVPSTTYTYITVPNSVAVTVSYVTQYYTTFAVSPSGSGSSYPGTNWYNAGSEVALSAQAASGYTFSKWTDSPSKSFTILNSKVGATEVAINGVGTLTATFKSSTKAATFSEFGLPSPIPSWSVTFDGSSSSGTGATITTSAHTAGGYSWSIAPVSISSSVEYVASPSSGSLTLPTQTTQSVVFVKEFLVTFVASPSSTGSVYPSGAGFYANNSAFPIFAYNTATEVFSKWSDNGSKVGLGSYSIAGTNASVHASTTVTATFKSGSECTTCTLTFNEVGLPAGTGWGVTFGSLNYVSSTGAVTVPGLTAGGSWAAFEPVSAGHYAVAYIPAYIGTTYTGSGYWNLGSTATIEVVYVEYAYVTFATTSGSGAALSQATGWYQMGAEYALTGYGTSYYTFSSWTSSGHNLTLGSTSASATTFTVTGPGTITGNFAQPSATVHFFEFGLPRGTVWGISMNVPAAVWYTSSGNELNITTVAYGGYNWGALTNIYGGTGLQWMPSSYYGYLYVPFQTSTSVVFAEQALLAFTTTSNTGGGTISPSATTYYWIGTVLPIMASNGATTPNFVSWSDTAGTGTISSTSSAATFVTVAGTGTVTAKF
jgi:hypothetical protein